MNIKNSFEKLSAREIVQLYLIVIMTYGLIFIFYKELSIMIYPIKTYEPSTIKVLKNNKQHTTKLSDLELLTYFNNNSKDTKIAIQEIKILQNSIEIKMIGAFKNIIDFLSKISHNFKIKQFEINKADNKIDVSVRLERQTFYISKDSDLTKEEIVNPFILQIAKKKYKASKIIVSAIVDFEILVNNTWYKKGDRVQEYLVLLIKKKEVHFLNTKTKKTIVKSIIYE